ncbi:RNB domain-containing ribonuclease [Nocardioides daejeonensis]|uniref:RNB domain-containing ribonuclease n=1 Tax=Nocardioides daejeonensis TaxID=1046556 RepID=UPI000D742219|nr:RNB domain-containing ribonuclease [Nocardioides daejeonensis]
MPSRVVHVRGADLRDEVTALQQRLGVTSEFPPEVEEAAARAATAPRLPELDRTGIPLRTIDPDGAMDLDQALHIERNGPGFTVFYAIADVAAFVTPDDPVDLEARRRGQTLYGADRKVPLHPTVLSEAAGSLLPDETRPALLWTIEVDETGEGTSAVVERALVRSRARHSYAEVQEALDAGRAEEVFELLREVGELRLAREAQRGGVSLPLPEQEVVLDGEHWGLGFRAMLPVEEWNAQISLLTGSAAASLMVYARVGILRTLPPADPRDVKRLHRTAHALGIPWPAEVLYPEFIRSLDPLDGAHAAMLVACTRLLRGSGYVGFDGELPAQPEHAAIAGEYAHVTAPLRRLVDRYASEICVSLCEGKPVPQWVLDRLHDVPEVMASSSRTAGAYERGVLDIVEAAVLAPRVGETFEAVVVEIDEKDDRRGDITIADPAIEARVTSETPLPLGEQVRVTLTAVEPEQGKVTFVTV